MAGRSARSFKLLLRLDVVVVREDQINSSDGMQEDCVRTSKGASDFGGSTMLLC